MNKVAAIQMCSSAQIEDNLAVAATLIQESAENGANLVVLPEMFPVIGLHSVNTLLAKEEMGHGKIQSFLSQQAKKHNIWIVGGTIPIACENKNQIKAACLVLNNQGSFVARYDKIHLFDAYISDNETYQESFTTISGNKLVVIDTLLGKLGLTVCYDIRFPELYRYLINCGAQIITTSAFTLKTGQAHWEILARSRAIENSCYISSVLAKVATIPMAEILMVIH
ncbi:MAG: nitrilase-related carbon-nitrogen hydrolase [Rickettsiella sp.]|nr:nitrilase-related carbon-nitrogen hydrolase [Rickettsiella sp.]